MTIFDIVREKLFFQKIDHEDVVEHVNKMTNAELLEIVEKYIRELMYY